MKLTPLETQALDDIIELNNRHEVELSWLDWNRLRGMIEEAYYAHAVFDQSAFLIAFDQDALYDSPNFRWFRDRIARFIYVDRIVVDPAARGRGLARTLYEDLFERARSDGHELVCCEVNQHPPNPASDRFHEALGFRPIGEAPIASGKTVRYLTRNLVGYGAK
jgi:predicted GNAT superfamily acetyltransferase